MRIKDKILEKKMKKEESLLNSAFELFTKKGINDTSIQEIANNAGVGKGTFYLYFKDKYDLEKTLVTRKSKKLFDEALNKLESENIKKFDDQFIFIIDYVIDKLAKNKLLLKLISKNLSLGIYNAKMIDKNIGVQEMFIKGVKESNLKLKNPDVTLYMIIELASSTCVSCILNKEPLDINEYKPYLYETIKKMLN